MAENIYGQQVGNRAIVKAMLSSFVFFMLFLVAVNVSAANTLRNYQQGELLPSFKLKNLDDGRLVTITLGKGKPTALFFFSINPEFRKQRALALLAELASLSARYNNRVNVVGIYVEDEGKEEVRAYLKTIAVKIPVLHDIKRDVYNKYGVFMMPLVVLATEKGKLHEVIPYTYSVVEIIEGNLKLLLGEWSTEQLKKALKPKENIELSKAEKEYIRRVNYGRVMVSRKMYSQALREFNTAIQLMPQKSAAFVEAGFALLKEKKWQQAERSFRNVTKIEPDSDDGIAGLGLALYGKGDIEQAVPQLENAFIAPKPRLEVILALADIYEQRGDFAKAIRLNKLAVSRLMILYNQRWK